MNTAYQDPWMQADAHLEGSIFPVSSYQPPCSWGISHMFHSFPCFSHMFPMIFLDFSLVFPFSQGFNTDFLMGLIFFPWSAKKHPPSLPSIPRRKAGTHITKLDTMGKMKRKVKSAGCGMREWFSVVIFYHWIVNHSYNVYIYIHIMYVLKNR